jgi:hypothetical protein
MSDKDTLIVDACKKSWDESWVKGKLNSDNCSGFFKSVAKNLHIAGVPEAQADGLVDYMQEGWTKLKTGVEALQKVRLGFLVAAGLKAADHSRPRNNGHVVIIVDGDPYHGKYPLCWCGSLGAAQSQGDLSVGEVWSPSDRDNVGYFMCPTKVS